MRRRSHAEIAGRPGESKTEALGKKDRQMAQKRDGGPGILSAGGFAGVRVLLVAAQSGAGEEALSPDW